MPPAVSLLEAETLPALGDRDEVTLLLYYDVLQRVVTQPCADGPEDSAAAMSHLPSQRCQQVEKWVLGSRKVLAVSMVRVDVTIWTRWHLSGES